MVLDLEFLWILDLVSRKLIGSGGSSIINETFLMDGVDI